MIISSGLETVEALAFDPLSQLLYWVDAGLKKIEVCVSPVLTQQVGLQPGGTDGAGGQVSLGNSQTAEDGPRASSRKERAGLGTLLSAVKGPTEHRHLPSRFHAGA